MQRNRRRWESTLKVINDDEDARGEGIYLLLLGEVGEKYKTKLVAEFEKRMLNRSIYVCEFVDFWCENLEEIILIVGIRQLLGFCITSQIHLGQIL